MTVACDRCSDGRMLNSCCGVTKDTSQTSRSNALDKQLARDNKVYRETHRLLLLGAGESGKSTIVKQMQIINMQGFSMEERQKIIPDIHNNIRDAMASILHAMRTIQPTIFFDNDDDTTMATHFLDNYGSTSCACGDSNFFDSCSSLWRSNAVQECYVRSNEYHLIDNAKYFLERISRIRAEDYMPDDQDILRCRVLTSHIRQIKFKVKDVIFHMFDVGGQRDQRRKWIQCFSDASAIVFVASLAGYNLNIREDNTTNRLQESLNLFKQVWKNRFLAEVSLILFLNKTDLLYEKVVAGQFKIAQYFPNYEFYHPTFLKKEDQHSSEPMEFTRAKYFFRDCFLFQTQEAESEAGSSSRSSRLCFPHFTCAVDTNNMRKIFEDCRLMIQRIHLDRFGILTLDT